MKEKIGKPTEERTKQEMANKTKARTIVEDTRKRKKYLQDCDSDTVKDVIKIKLHMWQVNCNYKKYNTDTKCPLCQKSEDTTEHVLECEKAKKFTLSKENNKNGKRWQIFIEKTKRRENLQVLKSRISTR